MKYTICYIIITVVFSACQNKYESGVDLLKEKKYQEAFKVFSSLDTTSDAKSDVIAALNYTKGYINYQDQKYKESEILFKKIPESSEFYEDSKNILNMISNDENIIYKIGISYTKDKEFDVAKNYLKKIKNDVTLIQNAQSTINYINGSDYYSKKDYLLAIQSLNKVLTNDEFYNDAKVIQEQALKEFNYEENKKFAQLLISKREAYQTDMNNENPNKYPNLNIWKENYISLVQSWKKVIVGLKNNAKQPDNELTVLHSKIISLMQNALNNFDIIYTYSILIYNNVTGVDEILGEKVRKSNEISKVLKEEITTMIENIKSKYNL